MVYFVAFAGEGEGRVTRRKVIKQTKLTFVQTTLLLRKLPRVAEGGVQVQLQVENSKQLMNDLPIHTRCGYSVHEA